MSKQQTKKESTTANETKSPATNATDGGTFRKEMPAEDLKYVIEHRLEDSIPQPKLPDADTPGTPNQNCADTSVSIQ
jgi:hypothetical protein